jgi:hypothetical protein
MPHTSEESRRPNRKDSPARTSTGEREGICELCQTVTDDWIIYNGAIGTCKCRKCYYTMIYPKKEALLENPSQQP